MTAKRYHIIIDIMNASNDSLNDEAGLGKFLTSLTSDIGMHVLKGPVVANGIPENPGLSGFVVIDFSHISIHTFTNHQEALVDIFSCKPYEQQVAVDKVLEYFKVPSESAKVQQVSWS